MSLLRMQICVVLLVVGSPIFAEDYEIRLTPDRAAKVGHKYEVVISTERSGLVTASMDGKVIGETESSVSATFEGTSTVEKIDKQQQVAELRLLVTKCRKKVKVNGKAAGEEDVLGKGTQFIVRRRNSKTEFLTDNKLVSKDIGDVLSLFFSEETFDFGTRQRKQVGESWPINITKAVKSFER